MRFLRRLREDQVSGLMLLALGFFVGWQNRTYPLGSLQEPGPAYVPLLIAIFLGATGLLIAVRGGGSKPLAVAAVAIGFSLLSFYLIGDVLRVPLPRGPWGW